MPRKKSVRLCAKQFRDEAAKLLGFCEKAEEHLPAAHVSLVYDAAVIRLYASFEEMILGALTGAINNNTSHISATTGVQFPKHLTDEVCEYIITGGGYFDFRGRDGLIRRIKKHVPNHHYLLSAIKDDGHKESLDHLCALRNYAAHGSNISKQAALKSVGQKRIRSAGSWLKVKEKGKSRFHEIASNLAELSKTIEEGAPY